MKKAKKPMTEMAMITRAVSVLRAGGLVAFPTETVYGLGADARQAEAIQGIFRVKKRPATHPLIVHIGTIQELSDWAREIPPAALKLAQAFWPGPLTLILKKQPHVLPAVTSDQDTVGVRMPNHPVALALLQAYGSGLVAPSANQFTHISPTTAEAVNEELGEQIDLILDGGECEVGLESTILDVSGEVPQILRPGMISAEAITAVIGQSVMSAIRNETRVPGMHHLHYAPQTPTSLIATEDLAALSNVCSTQCALLRYQTSPTVAGDLKVFQLPSTPEGYAHDLYRTLRWLDHQAFHRIYIEQVPTAPEWAAIQDRLLKATGGTIVRLTSSSKPA